MNWCGFVGILIVLFFTFSVKIKPAEVAISVDLYGRNKEVQAEVLPIGRQFSIGIGEFNADFLKSLRERFEKEGISVLDIYLDDLQLPKQVIE